ncbi:hypothetical protein FRB93_008700 [Tulasnella sp. JGI-2019a]|nr:hypothetical protein FRB93_008700 [Tulasnella sp. JGI-2019a]
MYVPISTKRFWITNILDDLGFADHEKFREQGGPTLLDEAIAAFRAASQLRSADDPARSSSLFNTADALEDRYQIYEDRADLEAALSYQEQALTLRPAGHSFRSATIHSYATLLFKSYEHTGNLEHLDTAIKLHRENLVACPPGHASRSTVLNNLAMALKGRFMAVEDRGCLEEAISYHLETLDLTPPGSPSRHFNLNSIGTALQLRYQHFDNKGDLDASIGYHMEALKLRPVGHPYRARSLANLGITLQQRYERSGDTTDLTTSIAYLQDALAIHSEGPLRRASMLSELANGHYLRFQQMREQEDLNASIRCQNEVLKLQPAGHPERPKTLANFARGLLTRYKIKNARADLDGAIAHIVEAREISPVGYPFDIANLQSLADAYILRFRLLKNREDIDKAVSTYQSILDRPSDSQSQLAFMLQNFATALEERYETSLEEADAETAVSFRQRSLDITAADSPFYATYSTGLAVALLQRIASKNTSSVEDQKVQNEIEAKSVPEDSPDVTRAISLFQGAANSKTCPLYERLRAALEWVRTTEPLKHTSLDMAYRTALHHLWAYVTISQDVVSQHFRLSDPEKELKGAVSVASAAAAFALEHSNVAEAVQFLEQGRMFITNELNHYRVPLDGLRTASGDLADEFGGLNTRMESDVRPKDSSIVGLGEPGAEDAVASRAAVSQKWFETVDRIRELPEFSDFLMPTPWDRLRTAAASGPVIIINISRVGSHAIIMPQDLAIGHLVIPLPLAPPCVVMKLSKDLRKIVSEQLPDVTTKIGNILRSLWDLIVKEVAKGLELELKVPRRSRVWWCLTSMAWSLPFHAAGPYVPGKRGFADLYTSSYTPSLTALIRSREAHQRQPPATPAPHILVVGMPQTPGAANLPSVMDEINKIKNTANNVTTLEGPEATRDKVLFHLRNHCWAHFACHGDQDEEHAFDSHFLLVNGRLTLLDILRSGLPNAELAFLSACHSATGDARTPDEAIHLAASMQFAGFAGVVGTLWAMSDVDGPAVAEEFYKYMFRNGEGAADYTDAATALAMATTALRRKKVPLERWINFVHYGA